MSNNYSHETSKPPYIENQALHKDRQCDALLKFIKRGCNNLLQLHQVSGIPQAVVSARMDDLKKEGKAEYVGYVIYMNRKRKKIKAIEPHILKPMKQQDLFEL